MRRESARFAAFGLAALVLFGACGSDSAPVSAAGDPSTTLQASSSESVTPTTSVTPSTAEATFDDPALGLDLAMPTTVPTTVPAPPTTPLPATDPFAPKAGLPTPVSPPPQRASEKFQKLGHLDIPKLGLSVDLYEGITLNTLDRGPGHWPGTAMPGETGNVVVAGHRVSHSRPFRYIDRLVPGDRFSFTINGVVSTYEVTDHFIVPPTGVQIVAQTSDSIATLFACHPPGSTRYRYVVRARLVT